MAHGKKRGHASLNSLIVAIVEDKYVDYQALTKHCSACKMWEAKKDQTEYDLWKANHICNISHARSSRAMKKQQVLLIYSIDLLTKII